MATALFPIFEKRINDAVALLITKQVDPWIFLTSSGLRVKTFSGGEISYSGVKFEGTPAQVFWSRYIEPFLEQIAEEMLGAAALESTQRGVDGKLLLKEVQGLLIPYFHSVYRRMADIDRRLRGGGYPENVPLRSTQLEQGAIERFVTTLVEAEIRMWKPARKAQSVYEWAVVAGKILAGLAGLAAFAMFILKTL